MTTNKRMQHKEAISQVYSD